MTKKRNLIRQNIAGRECSFSLFCFQKIHNIIQGSAQTIRVDIQHWSYVHNIFPFYSEALGTNCAYSFRSSTVPSLVTISFAFSACFFNIFCSISNTIMVNGLSIHDHDFSPDGTVMFPEVYCQDRWECLRHCNNHCCCVSTLPTTPLSR